MEIIIIYMNENCLKMSVDGFKWKENASKSNKKLIRNYDEAVIRDIFLKQTLNTRKDVIVFIAIYHSSQKNEDQ